MEVRPRLTNIRSGQRGCWHCSYAGNVAARRVPEAEAVQDMLKADLNPLEPFVDVGTPWQCLCLRCDAIVKPELENIRAGQGGCKYCAERGLNYSAPAVVYVITSQQLWAHKVGVAGTGAKRNRLAEHRRRDWELYNKLQFATGSAAYQVEQAVLQRLQQGGISLGYLSEELMPQKGASETMCADAISLPALWRMVEYEATKMDAS